MKNPGTSRYQYLLHLFFMLTLPIGLAKSTDSTSFWKQKAVIEGKNDVGQLRSTEIPALSEFTVCLDIFYKNNAHSTAFSYYVQNEKNPDISLSRKIETLEIFILGKLYEVNTVLKQSVWHTVCLMWKEQTNLLEVYVNETQVFYATTEQRKIKGNGSLVLGAQHANNRGWMHVYDSTTTYGDLYNYLYGDIYNFQMWNYTRSQEKLLNCLKGNLISWTKGVWDFKKLSEDVQLRCAANAAVTPLPTTITTTVTTTLDPQVLSTTKTTTIFTQPAKTSEPIIGTTQVVITSPTTTVIPPSRPSSATKSSTEIHSTSNVITPSSQPPTTPQTTPSRGTESLVSQSGTTNITSATGNKPNKVTFYIVEIKFTNTSMDVIDEDVASGFIHRMMDQLFYNTDFVAVQVAVSDTASPPEYIAKAIVRANSSKPQELLVSDLNVLLMKGLTDSELNPDLTTQNVTTKQLGEKHCRNGSTWYENFQYEWPETTPTEKASLQCHTYPNEMATRECYISVNTLETDWGEANYSKCIPSSFNDLENVPVTPENANYLAMQILNMTKTATSLLDNDIRIILNKLSEIIALGEIDPENAKVHIDVINTILLRAGTSISPFTNKILNLMEEVGFKMNFPSETANVTTDSMALLISKTFGELCFTVTTYLEGNLEITLEQFPFDKAVASIHLPKSIQNQAEISSSKVQFNFIGTSSPFQGSEPSGHVLNTYVISASFEGKSIKDLKDPVDITLWHFQENVWNFPVECAFWDFTKNNNMGGWNSSGCLLKSTSKQYTSCSCNHLTHFGVLLDITRAPLDPLNEHILTLLTYVGCGFASLFIGLALITYGMFKQLRRDYPSKILMNLCFSLLMLNLVFLVNEWLSSFRISGLCILVGALLHYFLLTSFTWMGLEAVHMYFAFVKVFNSYIHKYILKLCIAGWGIPLVVVGALLSANVHFYGDMYEDKELENPAVFCWIKNDTVFYTAVVCYFGLIFFLNISMFIVVFVQIKTLKSTRTKDWKTLFLHDIKNTLSLGLLLGLTWGFIFLAWGPVRVAFSYLFVIFNTLLGFFIFVFHCLIKESVRRHWRMYLCCGRCRIDNYSDWSRLSNGDTRYNGRIHVSPSDSYQSTRSNNTASTSNASSLSSFSRDTFYGESHVNGGGIFINPAHTASCHANVYPDSWRVSWLQTRNETN